MALCRGGANGRFFLWNTRCIEWADDRLFDIEWWRERNALTGEAAGRGTAHFVAGRDGRNWLLRHNRRGGVLAHLNDDRFLRPGLGGARSFVELKLLARMRALELPVPEPVAARAILGRATYRGDVMTVAIDETSTLADRLMIEPMPVASWRRLGAMLATFHRAGIWHADLNARNVLVDTRDAFHLIDFDKAQQRRAGRWHRANLARLRRSLEKIRAGCDVFYFSGADWRALRDGYTSVFAVSL